MRCTNSNGCQSARRGRCARQDRCRGAQASAAERAHLVQSLRSTSARIRAAAASGPPDEPAPPARAGGAGRIARLHVPDDRALSVHVALRRAGSLLHVTAQDCGDETTKQPPTHTRKACCSCARGRALLPSAHSSCRASTASHTAQRSPRLLRQPGERVSRRSRSSCARKRVGMSARRACTGPQLLGRARPAAQQDGFPRRETRLTRAARLGCAAHARATATVRCSGGCRPRH
jgi:hypothetical protein